MAETGDVKFCVRIHGCGSYPKLCKVGYSWVLGGARDLFLNSATAYISEEWLQLQSPVHAECVVLSMQPLPNYFGLLFTYMQSALLLALWQSIIVSFMQGLEATDDIITHQPLIEYIGNVMLRDQYDNGETSIERYILQNVYLASCLPM